MTHHEDDRKIEFAKIWWPSNESISYNVIWMRLGINLLRVDQVKVDCGWFGKYRGLHLDRDNPSNSFLVTAAHRQTT